jgi:ADP-heptose:LPS heptosyltransferase
MTARSAILVIKLGALGDVAQAFGAFAAIRAHHVGSHVVLLTTPPFAGVLGASPWFDEVWSEARAPVWRVGAWLALRRRIRAAGFARVYDLQTSARSDRIFRMLGPGARPEWVGRVAGASHRHADPRRDHMHTQDRLADQLAIAGVHVVDCPDLSWMRADTSRFGLPAPVALLVPGASPHRPEKRWPIAHFAVLAAHLAGRGIGSAVLGAGTDAGLAATIRVAAPDAVDLCGRTGLDDLVPLGRACVAAIGNDTGPMHWLAAAGAPVLTLFSSASDPDLCAPRGPGARILRRSDLSELAVDEVAAAAFDLVDGRAASIS